MSPSRAGASPPTALLVAAFATVYVVWGSTYLAIRFAVEAIPPCLMAGIRFVLAGAILYPFVRARGAPRPSRAHWRNAAIAGTLMLAGGNGLVCWSEQYVHSGTAALVVATVPIWFALLDWMAFDGRRPTLRVTGGIALGIAGVLVLVGSSAPSAGLTATAGIAALVIACALWSTGSLFARRAALPASPFLTTAMEMIAGGVALMLIGSATGEWPRVNLAAIGPRSWAALAYLVAFGSIAALSAYTWLLTVAPAARVATYAYVNPVIAVLLGALLGAEPLTPRVVISAAVIVAAVALTVSGVRPDAAPATAQGAVSDGAGAQKLVRT